MPIQETEQSKLIEVECIWCSEFVTVVVDSSIHQTMICNSCWWKQKEVRDAKREKSYRGRARRRMGV